ncbi:mersacidin/lichenicidin family type 2 lantibiotic [Metabacillus fastidiosus]|uniref:mersacidin/lichenicidin family type 2 lantibiotic n=1 Tax=Metabacillus fastidiosus TaxID=1458 RepID=UPI003D2DF7C7
MAKDIKASKEEIIGAWKDPDAREKFANIPAHPSGKALSELSEEELADIHGASDVKPETTLICGDTIFIVQPQPRPTSILLRGC